MTTIHKAVAEQLSEALSELDYVAREVQGICTSAARTLVDFSEAAGSVRIQARLACDSVTAELFDPRAGESRKRLDARLIRGWNSLGVLQGQAIAIDRLAGVMRARLEAVQCLQQIERAILLQDIQDSNANSGVTE